jgi:hypothetical protein
MLTYDFPTHYKGDTWDGITSLILTQDGVPVDLSAASILMQFKICPTKTPVLEFSTSDGSIIISTPTLSGEISIPPRIIDIAAQTYVYDLQYTLASGYVMTALTGKFIVTQDISYPVV